MHKLKMSIPTHHYSAENIIVQFLIPTYLLIVDRIPKTNWTSNIIMSEAWADRIQS